MQKTGYYIIVSSLFSLFFTDYPAIKPQVYVTANIFNQKTNISNRMSFRYMICYNSSLFSCQALDTHFG